MVNYIHYDRNAVYEMTLGEILDIIAHHHKAMDEQNKKLNSDNKQQKQENTSSQGDTVCYGRVADDGHIMTLEEIMAME